MGMYAPYFSNRHFFHNKNVKKVTINRIKISPIKFLIASFCSLSESENK